MEEKQATIFTEEDKELMESLPEEEQRRYNARLADITLRQRTIDDEWERQRTNLEKDCNELIKDLKERLGQAKKEQ